MIENYINKDLEFDWDLGNITKNKEKHGINPSESEEVFFNKPLIVAYDVKHSNEELRYAALGNTNANKKLFIAFTIRANKLRIISARKMNRNEKSVYYEREKNQENT